MRRSARAIRKRIKRLCFQALGLLPNIGFEWPGEDDEEDCCVPDRTVANIERYWVVSLGASSNPSLIAQAAAIEEDYVICDAGRRFGSLCGLQRLLLQGRLLEDLEGRYVAWFSILDRSMKYFFGAIENARLNVASDPHDETLSPLMRSYNTFLENIDSCGTGHTRRLWAIEPSEETSAASPHEHWLPLLADSIVMKRAGFASAKDNPECHPGYSDANAVSCQSSTDMCHMDRMEEHE